jgi:hypothetical protein
LAGVEVRGRDPLGAAVFTLAGAPAAGFHESVVRTTGQGQVVDVGDTVVGPVAFGVMDFGEKPGDGATGERAATILGEQHNSLIR